MMALKRAPFDIQFIDLNGVEESERKWILSSLHTSNPNVRLPWVKQSQNVCSYEAEEADATVPPMVNGMGGSYGPPGSFHLQGKCPPPVLFMHRPPTAPFKVSNSITEPPLKNGYCNSYQDTNGIGDDDHVEEVNNNVNGIKQDLIIVDKKEEAAAPSPPTTKSWASVLKPKEQETKAVVTAESKPPIAVVVIEKPPMPEVVLKEPFQSNRDDPNLHRMGEFLTTHAIDSRITSLQPRGLINRSNYCYINSILQAVMACPPVYNLFSGLSDTLMSSTQTKKVTPIIDGMIRLVKEFQHLPSGLRVGRRLNKTQKDKQHQVAINCDTPIEAHWMNTIFNGVRSDTFIVEGRQEDAEEFFGCLLNGLNDEMLELLKLVGAQNTTSHTITIAPNQEEDKEWQVMGPKNKGSITRRTELNRTPIIDIFGGLLRSRVQRAGDQTTDNIQPFFTLQLNVEKSQNIRDALEHLVNKNQLEGVTSLKTNEEIEAWQQVTIDKLPLVLVFHVKCFDYQVDGCSKITKALEFPIDLKIEPKVLSAAYNAKERQYKLFAVVNHEGKEATKGHYVTDTYHVGYANWLHYDDASVKPIPEERVLKPGGTRVPYLLFYRRNDTIANNNINNKK